MTQPPGWPPQGGYGPPQQPPQPPQYPGPYTPQPPAQAPGQAPNPYATPAQQPQPPYGQPPNYQPPYGAYPPPPPPPPGSGGGRNRTGIVIAAVVAAVVLVGGGVYLATSGGGGDDNKPLADKSTSAPPSESASTEGAVDPGSDETGSGGDYGDTGDGTATPPATGVVGQWQDDTNKTLTIGSRYASGDYKGDYPLSYIDPGTAGKGILTGMGTDRSDGSFRMVLKPMSSQSSTGNDYISATVTRSGDNVDIKWDDGGTDTLAYVGE